MLLLLGLLLYIDDGGNLTAVVLLVVYGLCCCILPVPLLQGLVHVPEKFETGEIKPPLYRAHPLDLLGRGQRSWTGPYRSFAPTGVVRERGEVADTLEIARARGA